LSGSIPPEIGNLTSLQQLYLNNNLELGGRLENICISELLIDQTKIELSDCCLAMRSWKQMGKTTPGLSADSTACCSMLGVTCSGSNVTQIVWYHQNLTGPIPPEIGKLKNLEILYLDHNHLTGKIPDSFTELKKLQALSVSNNAMLEGTFSRYCYTAVFNVGTSLTFGKCTRPTLQG